MHALKRCCATDSVQCVCVLFTWSLTDLSTSKFIMGSQLWWAFFCFSGSRHRAILFSIFVLLIFIARWQINMMMMMMMMMTVGRAWRLRRNGSWHCAEARQPTAAAADDSEHGHWISSSRTACRWRRANVSHCFTDICSVNVYSYSDGCSRLTEAVGCLEGQIQRP